jgi:hypothetical protein
MSTCSRGVQPRDFRPLLQHVNFSWRKLPGWTLHTLRSLGKFPQIPQIFGVFGISNVFPNTCQRSEFWQTKERAVVHVEAKEINLREKFRIGAREK